MIPPSQTLATATYGISGEMLSMWTAYVGTETRLYNGLLQLTRETVPGLKDMQYVYPTNGHNNGRISESIDGVTVEDVVYTYDSLQRLIAAQTAGPQWGNAYSYDGFGNLLSKTVTKGSAPTLTMGYDPATNRPTGPDAPSFDANGNEQVGTWDIENRLVSQTLDGARNDWGYDPNGHRVLRYQPGAASEKWTLYFYGPGGQVLSQIACLIPTVYPFIGYDACGTEKSNVYFGGRLVARTLAQGPPVQNYYGTVAPALGVTGIVTDRLGSVRASQTQTNGTWTLTSYYPYGEEKTPVAADGVVKFATYTRDSTLSNQDYADQRYYSNLMGRFYSPDPGGMHLANPASWNKYAYTYGDPVNLTDSDGREPGCAATFCVTVWGVPGLSFADEIFLRSMFDSDRKPKPNPEKDLPRATGEEKRWDRANTKLWEGNTLLQGTLEGQPSEPCQGDLAALQTVGVSSVGIVAMSETVLWGDATGNSTPAWKLFAPGSAAYETYSHLPNYSIGQYVNPSSNGITAVTAEVGSNLWGSIFFASSYAAGLGKTDTAALLMHELSHVLGATDPQLLSALGFDPNDLSYKITDKLKADCFK